MFKLPVVNIGDRNRGRESGDNVINVAPVYSEIGKGVSKAFSDEFKAFCKMVKNPYGDGKASDRIIKILENLEINMKLMKKRLTYDI